MAMKTHKIIKLLVAAVATAGLAQISPAPPSFPSLAGLDLYDVATGTNVFVPTVSGIANFVGTVGDYSVDISATGITIAGGVSPSLDLDIAAAEAGPGANGLDIYYSDGPFGPSTGTYTMTTLGPAVGGPVTTTAYGGANYFSQLLPLGGSLDTYPFTVNIPVTPTPPGLATSPYYLTIEDAITGSVVSLSSTLTVTSVPEPGNLMAFALALVPVGMLVRRHFRKGSKA